MVGVKEASEIRFSAKVALVVFSALELRNGADKCARVPSVNASLSPS